jgi:hypothetical protein
LVAAAPLLAQQDRLTVDTQVDPVNIFNLAPLIRPSSEFYNPNQQNLV